MQARGRLTCPLQQERYSRSCVSRRCSFSPAHAKARKAPRRLVGVLLRRHGFADLPLHPRWAPMGTPAWGNQLSAPEIDELVAYIHSLRTPAEPQFFFWSAKNARTPGTS